MPKRKRGSAIGKRKRSRVPELTLDRLPAELLEKIVRSLDDAVDVVRVAGSCRLLRAVAENVDVTPLLPFGLKHSRFPIARLVADFELLGKAASMWAYRRKAAEFGIDRALARMWHDVSHTFLTWKWSIRLQEVVLDGIKRLIKRFAVVWPEVLKTVLCSARKLELHVVFRQITRQLPFLPKKRAYNKAIDLALPHSLEAYIVRNSLVTEIERLYRHHDVKSLIDDEYSCAHDLFRAAAALGQKAVVHAYTTTLNVSEAFQVAARWYNVDMARWILKTFDFGGDEYYIDGIKTAIYLARRAILSDFFEHRLPTPRVVAALDLYVDENPPTSPVFDKWFRDRYRKWVMTLVP